MIGIIGAMDSEVKKILLYLSTIKEKEIGSVIFYEGHIGLTKVVVAKSGIGKVNAGMVATIMILEFEVKHIINTGIAGGILLETTDLIVCNKVTYYDVDLRGFGYKLGQVPGFSDCFYADGYLRGKMIDALKKLNMKYKEADIYSGDSFLSTSERLLDFDISSGAAIEMEGGAIAQVCSLFDVKFASIRFISDIIDSKTHLEDYSLFEYEAAIKSSEILIEVINSL